MSMTATRAQTFAEAVEAHARRAIANRPLHEKGSREALLERFLEEGVPTHKDEEWKYTSLRPLTEVEFTDFNSHDPGITLLEGFNWIGEDLLVVFANGKYSPTLSRIGQLPEGLCIHQLSEKTPERLGEIAKLEGKLGSTNDERFARLNSAAFEDGVLIKVAKGAAIEKPIHVVFLSESDSPTFSFPRVFIHAEENSQAKVVESHVGQGPYASISVAEVIVERNAVLEHTRVQDESPEALHIATLAVDQERDSTYTNNSVQFGARIGRIDVNAWIGGEHCETSLNGAYVGTGEQHLDNHTRIDHALPNCHSFEVYKGILNHRATGVFNGKIFVYPDAQKTDAKQTNQALLLSPTSTVDTKPQLEIFADDVKCTHGATVGQLREDALFYLRSRGIPISEARNLLVYAFVAEVLEKISVEPVRDALEQRLFQKLSEPRR